MRVTCACVALVAVCSARPLEWFAEEPVADVAKNIPNDLAWAIAQQKDGDMNPQAKFGDMAEPTSFLQTTTGGHPLECDCERVKCNCVKRCECQLPTSQQNHVASSFLEIVGGEVGGSAPLFVDIDTNECFLETGESIGQDQHHMLDCDCDKVKCNCVKHCECSLPSSAAASQADLLQVDEQKVLQPVAPPTENLLQEEEGLGSGAQKAHKKVEEESEADAHTPAEDDASTESFMKGMGMPDGPAQTQTQQRSRTNTDDKRAIAAKEVKESASASEAEGKGTYAYAYDRSDSGYEYSDKKAGDEKSDYSYGYEADYDQ